MNERVQASLADDFRELARQRIVDAGARLVAETGFGVSIEHIAEAAGVSTRTVFRYFATRDVLNAAIAQAIIDHYGQWASQISEPGDDVGAWIDAVAADMHRHNVELIGQAFWDVEASTFDLGAASEDFSKGRRALRATFSRRFADAFWHASHQTGPAPDILFHALDLHLNAFTTNAFLVIGYSLDEISAITAELLKTILAAAIAQVATAGPSRRQRASR